MIKISVKDTGIGISEENQHKLFKSFSKVTDDKMNPHGLGLLGTQGGQRLDYRNILFDIIMIIRKYAYEVLALAGPI